MNTRRLCITYRYVVLFSVFVVVLGLLPSSSARGDEYNPQEAGNPLRIIAYMAHPIGVLLDYGLMRPAHWLVHKKPLNVIFGHESEIPTADVEQ